MIGLIRYVTKVPTAIRSPYQSVDFYEALATWDTPLLPAGSTISILLDMGYSKKIPKREDKRIVNRTPSQYTQIISHGIDKGELIELPWIKRSRDADLVDDVAIFDALNDHLSRGGVVEWYEDYNYDPNDFKTMVATQQIYEKKRVNSLDMFDYTFVLFPFPDGQAGRAVDALTDAALL